MSTCCAGRETMVLRHCADNLDQLKATRIRLGHSWLTLFLAARGGGWWQLELLPGGQILHH